MTEDELMPIGWGWRPGLTVDYVAARTYIIEREASRYLNGKVRRDKDWYTKLVEKYPSGKEND